MGIDPKFQHVEGSGSKDLVPPDIFSQMSFFFFFYYYCLKNLFISKQGENRHAACSVSLMKSQLSILLGAATMPLLERVTRIMYTVFQSKDSTEVSVGGFLQLEIFQYHIWKQEQVLAFTVPVIGLSSSYTLFIQRWESI